MKSRTPVGKAAAAIAVLLILSLSPLPAPSLAQDAVTPTPLPLRSIMFSGRVESIDASYIVVSGLVVDIRSVEIPPQRLYLGATVAIVGTLQSGMIVASEVTFEDDTTSTPAATAVPTDAPAVTSEPTTTDPNNPAPPAPTQSANPRIVIEGPVRAISPTSIRVFEVTIEVDPSVTDVSTIRVGDYVRVQGNVTIANNTFNIVAVSIAVVNVETRQSVSTTVVQPQPEAPPPAPPPGRGSGRGSGSNRGSRGRS